MYLYETLHFVKQRDKASMVMEVQLNASNEIPSWKVTHPTWETDVGRGYVGSLRVLHINLHLLISLAKAVVAALVSQNCHVNHHHNVDVCDLLGIRKAIEYGVAV